MFYQKLEKLCSNKGVSITQMAKDLGISTGVPTGWKKGAVPRRSTVKMVANYFDVPVEFFDEGETIESIYGVSTDDMINAINTIDEAQKIMSDRTIDDDTAFDRIADLTGKRNLSDMPLTARDKRDIARDMEQLTESIETSDALMFDGEPLSPEAKESLLAAMRLGLEAAKLKNKERFTPNKYRKD